MQTVQWILAERMLEDMEKVRDLNNNQHQMKILRMEFTNYGQIINASKQVEDAAD